MIEITNMRVRRIVNQDTLQDVADFLGISRQYYNQIELLRESPSDKRIEQLENYYDKDINYLLELAE